MLLIQADCTHADPEPPACRRNDSAVSSPASQLPICRTRHPSYCSAQSALNDSATSRGTQGARRQVTMPMFSSEPASLRLDTLYGASGSRHSRSIKQIEYVGIVDQSLVSVGRTSELALPRSDVYPCSAVACPYSRARVRPNRPRTGSLGRTKPVPSRMAWPTQRHLQY